MHSNVYNQPDEQVTYQSGRAVQALISQSDLYRARLVHYDGDTRFPLHAHENCFLTVLLLGSMQETIGKTDSHHLAPFTSFMMPGVEHANIYGPSGALCLVIDFPRTSLETLLGEDTARALSNREFRRHGSDVQFKICQSLLAVRAPLDEDMFALIAKNLITRGEPVATPAPGWLLDTAARIESASDPLTVETLAKAADVHRVHLTRSFRRHFGITPKRYQLDLACLRVLQSSVFDQVPLTEAALKAGFCDLGHSARETRKRTGAPPQRISGLLKD